MLSSRYIGEFITASNALIRGVGGYYLQGSYITWRQAEEVETKYRRIYRAKTRGVSSAPNVLAYEPRGAVATDSNKHRRIHLGETALAAVTTAVDKALADVHDTSQRAAARSMVALSMERWGCRGGPPPATERGVGWVVPADMRGARKRACNFWGVLLSNSHVFMIAKQVCGMTMRYG